MRISENDQSAAISQYSVESDLSPTAAKNLLEGLLSLARNSDHSQGGHVTAQPNPTASLEIACRRKASTDGSQGSAGKEMFAIQITRMPPREGFSVDLSLRPAKGGGARVTCLIKPNALGIWPETSLLESLRRPLLDIEAAIVGLSNDRRPINYDMKVLTSSELKVKQITIETSIPISKDINRVLDFLCAVYGQTFGRGAKGYTSIARELGLSIQRAVGGNRGNGDVAISIRKGRSAAMFKRKVYTMKLGAMHAGDGLIDADPQQQCLAQTASAAVKYMRVEITFHDEGLKRVVSAGRRSKQDTLTMAAIASSIRDIQSGKFKHKNFIEWVIRQVFDEFLALRFLLNYSPDLLEKVKGQVEDISEASADAFDKWRSIGFSYLNGSGTFVKFLQKDCNWTRSRARRVREAIIKAGLDPDIPLDVYEAWFVASFRWDLHPEDREELTQLLAERDKLQESPRRGNSERAQRLAEVVKRICELEMKSRRHTANMSGTLRNTFVRRSNAAALPFLSAEPQSDSA